MTLGEFSNLFALPTALAGLLAALAKWLVDTSSRRAQAVLDERVRKIEAQLARESVEHEVRFRRIDQDVADVLSDVYDKLFMLYECSHCFVRRGDVIQIVDPSVSGTPEEHDKEALCRVEEANRAFKESFFRKRLYIPKDLFRSVKGFHDDLIKTVNDFTGELRHARECGKCIARKDWQPMMDRLNNEHTRLLDGITEAFQSRIGM